MIIIIIEVEAITSRGRDPPWESSILTPRHDMSVFDSPPPYIDLVCMVQPTLGIKYNGFCFILAKVNTPPIFNKPIFISCILNCKYLSQCVLEMSHPHINTSRIEPLVPYH